MLDELPGIAPQRPGQPGSGCRVGDAANLADADDPLIFLGDLPSPADVEQMDNNDLQASLAPDVIMHSACEAIILIMALQRTRHRVTCFVCWQKACNQDAGLIVSCTELVLTVTPQTTS